LGFAGFHVDAHGTVARAAFPLRVISVRPRVLPMQIRSGPADYGGYRFSYDDGLDQHDTRVSESDDAFGAIDVNRGAQLTGQALHSFENLSAQLG